jgi:hypothetical protein
VEYLRVVEVGPVGVGAGHLADGQRRPGSERDDNEVALLDVGTERPNLPHPGTDLIGIVGVEAIGLLVLLPQLLPVLELGEVGKLVPVDRHQVVLKGRLFLLPPLARAHDPERHCLTPRKLRAP